MQDFGNRIKEFRLKRGWIAEELGRHVGLTGASVGRIEKGVQTLTVPMLHKFSVALGVRMADLLEKDETVEYAVVLGSLDVQKAAGLFDDDEIYSIAVPNDPRITNAALVAFEISRGYMVGVEHKFPDIRELGATFVLQAHDDTWGHALSVRKFEKTEHGAGFSTAQGDPRTRWLPLGDKKIQRLWKSFFKIVWLGLDAS